MTDITDQDRRDMLEWARIAIASKDSQEHAPWATAARYILATVDAPAPTLAEELRDLFAPYATAEQEHIISRAKQTERERDYLAAEIDKANTDILHITAERDEARAEVERLTAEDKRKDKAAAEGVGILLRKNGDLTNTIARLVTTSNIINNGGRITYTEKDGKPVQESDTTTWKADE